MKKNVLLDIELFQGEVGFELQIHIPYVNALFEKGLLRTVKVVKGVENAWYYPFLPRHMVIPVDIKQRIGGPPIKQIHSVVLGHKYEPDVPFPSHNHISMFSKKCWKYPIYLGKFKNVLNNWKPTKPVVIIHNKFTSEWMGNPINFIKPETIVKICDKLSNFEIVYIHPSSCTRGFICDNSIFEIFPFEDLKAIPNLIFIEEILCKHPNLNFNDVQMAIHDVSDKKHISVQGGSSRIASLFGGTNIVLHKKGSELSEKVDEYKGSMSMMSNCIITVVHTDEDLISAVDMFITNTGLGF